MDVYPKARRQWAVSPKDLCLALSFSWSTWMTFMIFFKETCFFLLMTLSWFLHERTLMISNVIFDTHGTGLRLGTFLWMRTSVASSLSILLPLVPWHFQITASLSNFLIRLKTLASPLIALLNHLCTVLKLLKELVLPCSWWGHLLLPSHRKIFIPLYSTAIRPRLEYAIQASSPYPKKDIDHLEGNQ